MKPEKPLSNNAYGSIPHLIGSRRGSSDRGVNPGQHRMCVERAARPEDVVYVQEKLDGSNVAVARIDGQLIALQRHGYPCWSSRHEQHRLFAQWVAEHKDRFAFVADGWRVCGEWLAQAHGTRYLVTAPPFIAFDYMRGSKRTPLGRCIDLFCTAGLPVPALLHWGPPLSLEHADKLLGERGRHGAIDRAEGVIYRVERGDKVILVAKYVRADKIDGRYLPQISGRPPVWNWRPVAGT